MRSDSGPTARAHVLIGAYACGPGEEPEANAGWEIAVAAARSHDVRVVTRTRFRSAVEAALGTDPGLRAHLRVDYLDLPPAILRLKRGPGSVYWYYVLWQRALGKHARALHAQRPFDVAHHVTFASDWLPCGLARVADVPLVWGPVGGASRLPLLRMRRWLGVRGLLGELVRTPMIGVLRRLWGEPTARRADLMIAQNDDVARRFASLTDVVVEPNAALGDVPPVEPRARGQQTALFAGRLVGWKGPRLAVAALARPETSGWRLRIYGDGYERGHLGAMARRLGIADRVDFLGHRPRAELLAAYREADAFLFPSLHDQAGWVVAEASSAGLPVVCLPLGGPPILAAGNLHLAQLEGDVVANLARALVSAGAAGGTPHTRWSRDRLPDLLAAWYARVMGAALRGEASPWENAQ